MKKIVLFSLLLLSCLYSYGQTPSYVITNTFGTTGTSVSDNLIGNGAAFHKLTWNVSGTVSGCTVALDSSVDGNSWTAGGVIAGQTCTTNGTITSTSSVVNFVRINMTSFTGTGTVTVIDQGYVNNPAGGGGSGATKAFSTAYTNGTTSLTNVPGLALSVSAGTNYTISCYLTYSVDTSTATPNWAFTGPASPTSIMFAGTQANTTPASSAQIPAVTSFGVQTTTSTTTTITTNNGAFLYLTFQNGINAGTVQLQAAAHGAGTVTVLAGSACVMN